MSHIIDPINLILFQHVNVTVLTLLAPVNLLPEDVTASPSMKVTDVIVVLQDIATFQNVNVGWLHSFPILALQIINYSQLAHVTMMEQEMVCVNQGRIIHVHANIIMVECTAMNVKLGFSYSQNVEVRYCVFMYGVWYFWRALFSVVECQCPGEGSLNDHCDANTGQCDCDIGFGGLFCDECAPGYFEYPYCHKCMCNTGFTTAEVRTGGFAWNTGKLNGRKSYMAK